MVGSNKVAIGIRPPKVVGVTRNWNLDAPFPYFFAPHFIGFINPPFVPPLGSGCDASCDNVETSRHDGHDLAMIGENRQLATVNQ